MSFSITPRGGAFTARGGWSVKTTFYQDDFCIFNGVEYQSLLPVNLGNQPDVSPWAWVPTTTGSVAIFAPEPTCALGVSDSNALSVFLNGLGPTATAEIQQGLCNYQLGSSIVWAPPPNSVIILAISGTLKKLASFNDSGPSSGGLVIDGVNGNVTVFLRAPRGHPIIDGNVGAGATAVGLRVKNGATVIIDGGAFINNTNGMFVTDPGTVVDWYDTVFSGNTTGGGGTGVTVTLGALAHGYGATRADNNDLVGFFFNTSAAAGCHIEGSASNNRTPTTGGTGLLINSYSGTVGDFYGNGNGNGLISLDRGADSWVFNGTVGARNSGNTNGAQQNPSGFGIGLFGCTRVRTGLLTNALSSGYGLIFGRGSNLLTTGISNLGAGITAGATTIPIAGGSLVATWPVGGVLMLFGTFTITTVIGQRTATITAAPGAGVFPVAPSVIAGANFPAGTRVLPETTAATLVTDTPATASGSATYFCASELVIYRAVDTLGNQLLQCQRGAFDTVAAAYPDATTFTATTANGSPTLNAVSSFAGLVVGDPIVGANIPPNTTILALPGGGQITMSNPASGNAANVTVTVPNVAQNLTAHHNQVASFEDDNTGNWDTDPGIAFTGGCQHNTVSSAIVKNRPAAVSGGEGAAGSSYNVIETLVARECSQEIISVSGGSFNIFDRVTGYDCAPGSFLFVCNGTNWPVHDNVIRSLKHFNTPQGVAPTGNMQQISPAGLAANNYIESKLAPQFGAPAGKRYNFARSRQPSNQANALTAGTVYVFSGEDAYLPGGIAITQLSVWLGSTAIVGGVAHFWLGLVNMATLAAAGDGTISQPNSGILAISADTPGLAFAANAETKVPIVPQFMAQENFQYGVVFMMAGPTTMPTLIGTPLGNTPAGINVSPRLAASTSLVGQSAPLALGTAMPALTNFTMLPYTEATIQ